VENLLFKEILAEKEYITELRRQIHTNPEISMKEFNTTKLIKSELEKYGVELVDLDTDIGVLGILRGTAGGEEKVVALRADIDALPINEKTDLPYKSAIPGVMHACGHDGHTAILLGTAKVLAKNLDKFSGIVKFIFQPGEEMLSGAKHMIEKGVLENPKVDTIVALHAWPFLNAGELGFWKGPYYAGADWFDVNIIGESGHGAYPHKTKDSLIAATNTVLALQSIISRQTPAIQNTVISICRFNAGTANNIIPHISNFGGTVRSHNEEIRNGIPAKMEKIIKGVSEAYGCDYELTYTKGVSVVDNNPDTVDRMIKGLKNSLGDSSFVPLPEPVMGSEDFAEYGKYVKDSAIFRLGNTDDEHPVVQMHSEKFNFNDNAIPYGINAFVQFVVNK